MAQTVVGLFDNSAEAQQAVEQLVKSGFSRDKIDLTSRSTGTAGSSGSQAGSSGAGGDMSGNYTSGNFTGSSYAGKGSDALNTNLTTGDTSNDTLGTNYSGTSYGERGSDSLNTDLSGSQGRSETIGTSYSSDRDRNDHKGSAIGNFFRSLFGNDEEAETYSNVANRSGSIVTVHAQSSDEAERAADILDDAGAVDVNERASQYGYSQAGSSNLGTQTTDRSTMRDDDRSTMRDDDRSTMRDDNDTTRGTSIPIIEEQLQVGKRTVETGGKRLRSRIVERPVEEDLRLREERVWVERNTVDRPATEADLANFQQKEFELIERAEVPVVSKEARVVEEVSLGKEVEERVETVRDSVRNTEVDVEDIEKNTRRSSTDLDSDRTDDLNTRKDQF